MTRDAWALFITLLAVLAIAFILMSNAPTIGKATSLSLGTQPGVNPSNWRLCGNHDYTWNISCTSPETLGDTPSACSADAIQACQADCTAKEQIAKTICNNHCAAATPVGACVPSYQITTATPCESTTPSGGDGEGGYSCRASGSEIFSCRCYRRVSGIGTQTPTPQN